MQAGLDKEKNPEGYAKLDVARVGVLIGTGMGGLTVFQDGEITHKHSMHTVVNKKIYRIPVTAWAKFILGFRGQTRTGTDDFHCGCRGPKSCSEGI